MIKIGVRAHDYGKLPVEKLISRIADDGFKAVQLAIPKAVSGINSYDEVNESILPPISKICKTHDIEIAVLGCYVNAALMDENLRKKEVDTFLKTMTFVRPLEAVCIGTETTPFALSEDRREEAFDLFVRSLAQMAEKAEELQVDIGIEPVASHTINTPEITKRLLNTVKSERLKVIFDPVNLLTTDLVKTQDDLWKRCFEAFGEKICALHMKGVQLHPNGRLEKSSLNEGIVHFDKIIQWIKGHKPNISLLREEIDPAYSQTDKAFIQSLIR